MRSCLCWLNIFGDLLRLSEPKEDDVMEKLAMESPRYILGSRKACL